MQAPTGAGKTAIAAEIAYGCWKNGLRVWFVAPYTTLIEQTEKAWLGYGLPQPGIMWQDHERTDDLNKLQIVSADTLIRRELPDDVDLVILDECHLKREKILEWLEGCEKTKIVGLTATPFSAWLGKFYENFIKVCTVRQLIDEGYLSEFELYAPIQPDMSKVKSTGTTLGYDYNERETSDVMSDNKIVGNIVQHWLLHGEDRPTIAFCVDIMHANHVANGFTASGVACEVITGKTPIEEREMIFKRFADGVTKIICNVGVLVAGFDGDVRCIIYARPTKSEIRWIQCIGRGLRTAAGKNHCLIFDHSGTVHRLGMPDEIEYETLPNGKMKSQQSARLEEVKKEMVEKECPKCKFIKPAGVHECPKCGFKPRAGKDVEVDEDQVLVKVKGKQVVMSREKLQDFYSELIWYYNEQVKKGKTWKPGWPAAQYKKRFGIFPGNNFHKQPKETTAETAQWLKGNFLRYMYATKKIQK